MRLCGFARRHGCRHTAGRTDRPVGILRTVAIRIGIHGIASFPTIAPRVAHVGLERLVHFVERGPPPTRLCYWPTSRWVMIVPVSVLPGGAPRQTRATCRC